MSAIESLVVKVPVELPQTLTSARSMVLVLPGMEHYVPDRTAPIEEIERQLEQMVEQVTLQLDAENMLPLISNDLGWSDKEAEEFFIHPDRKPYQTPIQFSEDHSERVQQFLTIGNYLKYKYLEVISVGDSRPIQRARENLRNFLDFSAYNLFVQYDLDYKDHVNGINPEDRRAGTIKPTEEMLNLIQTEVEKVAQNEGVEPEQLYQEVLNATEGGSFITIGTFLNNKKGSPQLRRALEAIVLKRISNPELMAEKLQLLLAVETYRLAMGIDLELFYELGEYPDGQSIEARLHEFLTHSDYVDNVWAHLHREAAPVVSQHEKANEPMDYYAILQARAEFRQLPDTAETISELEEKKQRVWSQMREILPLAFVDTPLSYIDSPATIGATPRAANITYHNEAGGTVNVVVLNVRENESDFRETTGHELGHKLHAEMLTRAEAAGYVPTGSNERVPGSVKEEFSQLVEDQVGKIWKSEMDTSEGKAEAAEPPEVKGEFRDLFHAIVIRRQAPYALIQRAVRIAIEERWMNGVRYAFTAEELQTLIDELQPQVLEWYAEGVPIFWPQARVYNNTEILDPTDGLVYLKKYLVESVPEVAAQETMGEAPSAEPQESKIDMKYAFEQRFGEKWLENPDARAVLLVLLAETGNNYDITTYGQFVLDVDIEKVRTTLLEWGITEDLI